MKNIILLIIALLISSLYKSQSVIIDINDSELGQPNGYYSKDLHNVLNQFEGTYLYTKGNTSFKIVLVKKIKQYNSSYYEDLIIGEYQYIVNGVEKANTLSNLNVVYNNQFAKHAIAGNYTIDNNTRLWKRPQCNPNEKRLSASITDVSTNRTADFFVRKTVVNGQEVLQVKVTNILPDLENMNPAPFTLPTGEFTMIKP
ncbi:DUF6705 family protein [Chryseobacterium takakiae]|uniref:DUF6705 domain-containing protein n=1 Tax=Chryseobacterium takakiae TaxID=1302685 RepID=A0A1M4XLY1_9FLAO|nr:DUF6705 family protein [Chryseobacterium takakiae]SHE94617.1 hypothetical protein SAMN05444408_106141 [Chryseobacterium takakiae]